MSAVTRVLIIGLSNIGDAILSCDVVDALARRYPQAHVTLVVGARAKPLFVDDPRIHTLVDADAFDTPFGRLRLALALWRYRPHVVVDLRRTIYPLLLKPLAAWRYLRRAPARLGHMRERHRWTLQAHAPDAAPMLRVDGAESHGAVWISPHDLAHVESLWRRWRLREEEPFVLIAPGARSHIKRWTAEGFAQVADRLIAEGDTVIFSGEPEEEPIIEEIMSLMRRRAHSAVGLVTIRQLGALMQRARLVVTNDSGALHLASALDVPTVAIFGPTDARKYGPTSVPSRTVRRRLFCAPCERALCRFNHECMRFISPDEVLGAVNTVLDVAVGRQNAECGVRSAE